MTKEIVRDHRQCREIIQLVSISALCRSQIVDHEKRLRLLESTAIRLTVSAAVGAAMGAAVLTRLVTLLLPS